MALTLESANRVRQKSYEKFYVANPGVFYAMKALFLHLACNKANPDLQYVNLDGTFLSSDGGNNTQQVVANVGCTLYALYTKKFGTTTTWLKYNDSATVTVGNGTDTATIAYANAVAGEERLALFPVGQVFANGIAVSEETTATGTTLTLKANRIDGFFIIGA
jgi:hypothetical protein